MTKTKPYVAIGYFKHEGRNCHRFVANFNNSLKEFREDLIGNAFKASFVMTYKTFKEVTVMSEFEVCDKAWKMNRHGDYQLLYDFAQQLEEEVDKELADKLDAEIIDGFVPEGTTLESYLK